MATPDPEQFHQLFEPHLEALFRAAFRLTGNTADAEDLVQDTCIRAFQASIEVEDTQSIRPWLLSVLYHKFVDTVRHAARSPLSSGPDTTIDQTACPAPGPEAEAMQRQSEDALHRAWLELEHGQRALLALRAEGYSPAEIATVVDVPLEALYARLYRARLSLAEQLRRHTGHASNDRLRIAK